ncbi:DNA cytosine methyltransferase [Tetragenococcus halophilus]|uniref:DNA cytosine methyltransferase n=1 Tax=Tetragenococcus halophilus TaxID=51669 RepID=UPI001B65539E|nr:DNA cytosine methyltransferase [Tetragenococcus halophilus]MCO8287035.1 DNA cytosine methyltransferase [Tetragenococcus halophilus]GLL51767.1 cytosine-specific methyltransferase [Tetragenococcus halophilus]
MKESANFSSMEKYTVAGFFSGVGGIELGFQQTNKFKIVYANEFDKNAQITYVKNHSKEELDKRDIHEINICEVPETDAIVGGFPCQAFSIAGYRKGFEDERGDLFFELLRFIKANKPKTILIENVKNMVTHDHGNTFKIIREALTMNGYYIKWKVLNSKNFGNVPQNRERIYIVGFRSENAFNHFQFPAPVKLTRSLTDVIDFESKFDDTFYYMKGKQPFYDQIEESVTDQNTIYQWRRRYVRGNKTGVVPTLTANMGTGGHNVPIIKTKNGIRKLTPRETFNVQGFPKDFQLPKIANSQLYKQAGNSVVVPVIKRIAENIATALKHSTKTKEKFNGEKNNIYIMFTKMDGRFSGESSLVKVVNNIEGLENFAREKGIVYMSDKDYLKNVQKNKTLAFYSYSNN